MSNQIITELKEIASKSAKENGFELIDLKMNTHLNPLSIQINIRHKVPDKKVTIDDCSIISKYVDDAIQNSTILNQPFNLEISSEGIGELLSNEKDFDGWFQNIEAYEKDFEIFKGFPIEVTYQCLKKVEHQTNGLLLKRSDNDLQINQKGKIKRIPVEDVIKVRLTSPSG